MGKDRMSKSQTASQNTNRNADFLQYSQDNLATSGRSSLVGTVTIGSPTVDQTRKGIQYPSVQAAVDQLAYALIPVGGFLITDSASSPGGVNFEEQLTVTGVADDLYVTVYGIPVAVEVADDATAIAGKIKTALDATGLFLGVVQAGATLTVTHRDRQQHEPENTTHGTVTITGNIIDQSNDSHVGYGDWSMVHNATIGTESVYYWKRIG
ncbi:baseplate wedge subunit [Vibrio phage EniLVp02]